MEPTMLSLVTTAMSNVLTFGTSILTWITASPVLALSIGFPLVAGAIGIVRRIV